MPKQPIAGNGALGNSSGTVPVDVETVNKDSIENTAGFDHKIKGEWPGRPVDQQKNASYNLPAFQAISALFEQQVFQKSTTTCLVFGQQKSTFAQVNASANQLARHLLANGLRQQQVVPVILDRSIDLVVSLLAILKAGGAYVPINPEHPAERIKYILEDVQATLVITNKQFCASKINCLPGKWIEIDGKDQQGIQSCSDTNLYQFIHPNQLAYVIYTSGSTGQPKGVMIEHGALHHYLVNPATSYLNNNANSAGSFIYLSPTFDASITALFMPMINGKLAVITNNKPAEVFLDENLKKYAPYDFIKTTPAHLEFLAMTIDENEPWLTKRLVIGGEALHVNQLSAFAGYKDIEVINEYGPTEATVGCITFNFRLADIDKFTGDIPIGTPIKNTAIYLLQQKEQNLVPANEGEICIGGQGLARSYINNDTLTGKKFISNPVSNSPYQLLYRTGDLAKRLSTGDLIYLGRTDDQVKIGGIRIETGEVEAHVSSLAYVQNTCVTIEEQNGVKKLVCFIVPRGGTDKLANKEGNASNKVGTINSDAKQELIEQLKHDLHKMLPDYMVPSRFEVCEAFPLTAHGKIDRKKLLGSAKKRAAAKQEEKLTDTEKSLSEIWQKVLGIPQVGMNDNFFNLGGNSIQAAQLFNHIRKSFNQVLPLSTLIQTPTIWQLAAVIEGRQEATTVGKTIYPFRTSGINPPLFLVHGGAGNILFYHDLVQSLSPTQPVYGIMALGLDGRDVQHQTVEEMAACYIESLLKIQPSGPYLLAGYCFGAVVCYEMAYQLKKMGKGVSLLASINGVSPTYRHLPIATTMEPVDYGHDLPSKIAYHKKMMAGLNLSQKIFYPLNRVATRVQHKAKKQLYKVYGLGFVLRYKALNKIYQHYLAKDKPIPLRWAKDYYFNTNVQMVNAYGPKLLDVNMLVLRSPGLFGEKSLGWKDYVRGNIETVDLPGEHTGRRMVLHPPFVQYLADKLQAHIDKMRK